MMIERIDQLINPRKIEYITLDQLGNIIEFSPKVHLFSDTPEQVITGTDSRQSFPELIGLDNVLSELVKNKVSHFKLKNICIEPQNSPILYRDLHAFKNRWEETSLAGDILIIFEESTEQSLQENRLTHLIKDQDFHMSYSAPNITPVESVWNSMIDLLIITDVTGQIKTINRATIDCFGYCEQELIDQSISVLFLDSSLDLSMNLVDLSDGGQLLKNIEVNCQTKSGSTIPISFSCSPFQSSSNFQKELIWLGRDITDYQQFNQQLTLQVEQTRFLNHITQRIHQSLNLEMILQTTVTEIQQFLRTDHVLFYQFYPDKNQHFYSEIIGSNINQSLNTVKLRYLIDQKLFSDWNQKNISYFPNVNIAEFDDETKTILNSLNILALLTVPIFIQSPFNQSFWGTLVICHPRPHPPTWELWKVHLLKQLSLPLASAIHQAQLYAELQWKNEELEKLSLTDALTQIANRHDFDQTLEKEWRRLRREAAPLSLIFCDVDYFKEYNDTYGHPAGDACLQLIASVLRDAIKRPADKAARYGGDEFALILPNTPSRGGLVVAQWILDRIQTLKIPHQNSPITDHVTITLGVACLLPIPLLTVESLIQTADQALYNAKQNGRNCVFVISENEFI